MSDDASVKVVEASHVEEPAKAKEEKKKPSAAAAAAAPEKKKETTGKSQGKSGKSGKGKNGKGKSGGKKPQKGGSGGAGGAGGAAGSSKGAAAAKPVAHGPETPVRALFPDGHFPVGQRLEYEQPLNLWRRESEEQRQREKVQEDQYESLREAAEAHRIVRQWAKGWIKPGMRMIDIADTIETSLRKTVAADGTKRGIAFPTGLSLNHVAAHYTPNAGDTRVLQKSDVMKVDIGLQVNGWIIDSAFTMAFDPVFDPLLETVREATNAGVKAAGIDVRLCEIGEAVEEVMTAGELTLGHRTHHIVPVRNLMGHSLGMYTIHAGKSVPICKGWGDTTTKMEEGDLFAIETFGSTGHGLVHDDMETSHYMKAPTMPPTGIRGGPKAQELYAHINKNYSTLAFARRWLDQAGITRYAIALKSLVDCGAVNPYPPLVDCDGSYVAQFEHTIALKPTGKEVFSRGDDY